MKNLKSVAINKLRPFRNLVFSFTGFLYDYSRLLRYGGWSASNRDESIRKFKLLKIFHRLEKSLSFRFRNKDSGWRDVLELKKTLKTSDRLSWQDQLSINVLKEFVTKAESDTLQKNTSVAESIRALPNSEVSGGGARIYGREMLSKGIMDDPEQFFDSRYSVRDFANIGVDHSLIKRALMLAMKTPSVCNRQAWHVYGVDDRANMDKILAHQNGNRGFGHEIPFLLIITTDLKAFDIAGERYQHWIDGGMYSMSVVYALHSLGLGSCCLNWSRTGKEDRAIRKILPIEDCHTITMMLAVGYPNDHIKVCDSPRRGFSETYTHVN